MKNYFIFLFINLSILLHADYILLYDMETEKIQYTYKNNSTSKMINNSEDGLKSVYLIDDNTYLVSQTPSGLKIKDANNLAIKKRVYDPSAHVAKQTKPNYKIKKTSKRKTVAGIDGEVWMVFGRDGGQVYSQYVVVTSDPVIVKIMRNMFTAYSKMNGEILDLQNIFEIEPGYMLIKTDNMKLASFQELTLSPDIYTLPKTQN